MKGDALRLVGAPDAFDDGKQGGDDSGYEVHFKKQLHQTGS